MTSKCLEYSYQRTNLGNRQSSALARQEIIVAWGGWGVCDDAHRLGVMKKGTLKSVVHPAPGPDTSPEFFRCRRRGKPRLYTRGCQVRAAPLQSFRNVFYYCFPA